MGIGTSSYIGGLGLMVIPFVTYLVRLWSLISQPSGDVNGIMSDQSSLKDFTNLKLLLLVPICMEKLTLMLPYQEKNESIGLQKSL